MPELPEVYPDWGFRANPARDSDGKAATDSETKAATDSDGKAAIFGGSSEGWPACCRNER